MPADRPAEGVRTHRVRRGIREDAPVWVCEVCDESWLNDNTTAQPWLLERQPCGTREAAD